MLCTSDCRVMLRLAHLVIRKPVKAAHCWCLLRSCYDEVSLVDCKAAHGAKQPCVEVLHKQWEVELAHAQAEPETMTHVRPSNCTNITISTECDSAGRTCVHLHAKAMHHQHYCFQLVLDIMYPTSAACCSRKWSPVQWST